jgi:Raf kinase inhibitor-like YbhB/YbcL family protein
LAELIEAAEELSLRQQDELEQLRHAVEEATGHLPGMTEQEAKRLSHDYLKRGLEAFYADDYVAAEGLFERAAVLEEHLDDWGRSTLSARRAQVAEKLAEVRAAFAEARRRFEQGDYAGASALLQTVLDSDISIGAEQDREVARLLGESKERLAALQRERRERRTRDVGSTPLAGLRALIEGEKYEEAGAQLAEIQDVAEQLSEQQQDELQELWVALARALERQRKQRLAGILTEAKALVWEENYSDAEGKLAQLADATEELDEEQKEEIGQLVATLKRVRERQRRERATGLLAEAKALVEKKRFEEAEDKLTELTEIADALNERQREELQELRLAVEEGSKLTLTSPAFEPGGMIPARHTDDGPDLSPPLAWQGVPDGTVSFAIIMEDPDAPWRTFTHWLICEIPGNLRQLPEGIAKDQMVTAPITAFQGRNSFRKPGYGGPAPSEGETHRYIFYLYALDEELDMTGGFSKNQLKAAISGHVLEEAELMGRYER